MAGRPGALQLRSARSWQRPRRKNARAPREASIAAPPQKSVSWIGKKEAARGVPHKSGAGAQHLPLQQPSAPIDALMQG